MSEISRHNVIIGKDKWSDPEIQVWDADTMTWRVPATTEEKVDALMALVLKMGGKLQDLGS
jgi:hypothetical protein